MRRTHAQTSPLRRLVARPALRCALLAALVIAPAAVYAGQVTGLIPFVNGEITNANQVNANFTALSTAINDNDGRITTLENLLGASCPAGQFVRGISAGAGLVCATP